MKTLALIFVWAVCAVPGVQGQLFSDDFTRGTDPGPLAPWLAQSGNWTMTGGVLQGGTNGLFGYSSAYVTNSWTNYSVQARIQFPAGAFGGGLAARLNSATGARYAIWIYPEGSAGGSNLLKLLKFQTWTTFGYLSAVSVPMQSVSLAAVGTNWHSVKLDLRGSRITVSYDGSQNRTFV